MFPLFAVQICQHEQIACLTKLTCFHERLLSSFTRHACIRGTTRCRQKTREFRLLLPIFAHAREDLFTLFLSLLAPICNWETWVFGDSSTPCACVILVAGLLIVYRGTLR